MLCVDARCMVETGFPGQSTDCWEPPQTQNNDSHAPAEDSGRLRQRRGPKVAIARTWDLLLRRCSANRSGSKKQSRYVYPSREMRHALLLRGNVIGLKHRCQIRAISRASK